MVQHRPIAEKLFFGESKMAMLLQSQDWTHTSLGAIAAWSPQLKTTLNILFNTCCPMLLVWGCDRILFYNDAAAAIVTEGHVALRFGVSLNPDHGKAWSGIRTAIEQVFTTGRSHQSAPPSLLPQQNGQQETPAYTWCYSPLWDEVGQVSGVFVTGYPAIAPPTATVRRETCPDLEKTLQQREEQLRLITNALPVLIAYVDKEHYYRFNNQTYETWFGQPATTLTNRHVRDVLGDAVYAAVLPYMQQALAGQWVSYEGEIPYQGGGTRYIRADYIPHVNQQGEVEGYFSLVSDISDRRRTEAERTQAEAYLRESEERFRLVTQAVSGLIFDWNLQTNEVYRSEKLYNIVGIAAANAPPDAAWWQERIHPDDWTRLQPEVAKLFASNDDLYDAEYRVWHEAGHWVNVWEQAYLIRDEHGQITRIVGCTVDITDRKQTETEREQLLQELATERAQFEAVLRQMPAGVIIAQAPSGQLILGNQQAEQIWQQPLIMAEEIDEYHEYKGFHADGRLYQPAEWPLARSLLTGEVVTHEEIRFCRRDGTEGVMEASSTPIYNQQGQIMSGVVIFQDITERKRIEEALRTSEERLRFAIEGAALGTWEYELASGQLIWAEHTKRMFGVPLDAEVNYDRFIQTIHPDDRDRVRATMERAIAQQALYDVELRSVWADTSIHWIRSIGRARYDQQGVPIRMIGVALDITTRKQAEVDLRESERRFRRLVESNMFGVAFGNFAGGIEYVNDYFLNMVGYSRAEIETGQVRWMDITPAEFLPLDERAAVELRTRGVATPFEKEYIRKDGTRVPVLIGSALRQEPYDQQQEIIAFYIDLTEQKEAAAERERLLQQAQAAREEAETANRIKDEFLAVLSHELRSPLNPILGWSRLLQTRQFDEKSVKQALQTIERNAKLQTQLIDDLLDVSRILRGKMVLNICPVDLVTVIEAAMETVRLAAEAKAIDVQFVTDNVGLAAAPPQPPLMILGDAARLQQIVWNLLSNAVKFTPDRGQIVVCLELVEHGDTRQPGSRQSEREQIDAQTTPPHPPVPHRYAQIQVRDTGKGISPDFLPYVFDYFRQEDGKTTRKFGGLGLGLAIVRHLTELHGGTVHVESGGEGQGASFFVRLPLLSDTTITRETTPTLAPTFDFSQFQILVVDDDEDMRELVRVILEQQGAQVTVARSAVDALGRFDRQLPDLLISDIGMPEMDGYMLMQQIRQRSPEQGGLVPAIALTAYAGEYDHQQALKVGFQQHVAKPVEPEALIRAIVRLVSNHAMG